MSNRPSLDEILSKREGHVISTDRGDAIVKTFKAPTSWNQEERSARFTMTAQAEDRMKDIVRTNGLDTTEFEKNPVMLMFHNSRSWPVGKWMDIQKIGGKSPRMEGTAKFADEGTIDEADKAASLVSQGILQACSIGFIPKDYEWIKDDEGNHTWGIDFIESELTECSIVPVPAQPAALVKSAGGDMTLCRDMIEEVLDTYAKTPEGLLVPREDYVKAYKAVKFADLPQPKSVEKVTLALKVDTEGAAEMVEEATHGVLKGIIENLSKLLKATPDEVKDVEPVVEPDPEPVVVLASEEAVKAMREQFAEIKARNSQI